MNFLTSRFLQEAFFVQEEYLTLVKTLYQDPQHYSAENLADQGWIPMVTYGDNDCGIMVRRSLCAVGRDIGFYVRNENGKLSISINKLNDFADCVGLDLDNFDVIGQTIQNLKTEQIKALCGLIAVKVVEDSYEDFDTLMSTGNYLP